MITQLSVNHLVYRTTRSFDAVVVAFETVVGTLDDVGWASIPASVTWNHRIRSWPVSAMRFKEL